MPEQYKTIKRSTMDRDGNFTSIDDFTETGDEIQSFALRMQIDAIFRASAILSYTSKFSTSYVVDRLALAEKVAQYNCGFTEMSNPKDYVRNLQEYVVRQGYVTSDGLITEKGNARAKTPLPPQIEAQLKK